MTPSLRGDFKYYFADFVRKGGGGTPQIRNPLFAEKKSVNRGVGVPPKSVTPLKGGGTPLTDKIRKVVFDGTP